MRIAVCGRDCRGGQKLWTSNVSVFVRTQACRDQRQRQNRNALTFNPTWTNSTLQIAGSFNKSGIVKVPAGNLILSGGGQNTGTIRLNNAAAAQPNSSSSLHIGDASRPAICEDFTLGSVSASGNALVAFDGGEITLNIAPMSAMS